MNNVVKRHNVLVLELLHERDLADGRTRGSFFGIEVDLLEGDELARLAVAALEDLRRVSQCGENGQDGALTVA